MVRTKVAERRKVMPVEVSKMSDVRIQADVRSARRLALL